MAFGAGLVIVAAVWIGMRRIPSADAPAGPETTEAVTLRFFKDPATVPDFTVVDLDGRRVSLADARGKVVIVNFWATWCPPCRAEIPALVALQEKYRDRLLIIGISEDEGGPEMVKQYVAEQKINYPVALTTPEVSRLFPGVGALPTSFIIDREQRIVQKHVGMLNPLTTELETRSLAGLPVNATIEKVDKLQPAKLDNAAATDIPGVDLKPLSPAQRVAALTKLNSEGCTCGCELTLAKCRIDDPSCGVSLPLARQIVQQIADASPRP
jgi:thiol-disulfide isomerase/thioredoxin